MSADEDWIESSKCVTTTWARGVDISKPIFVHGDYDSDSKKIYVTWGGEKLNVYDKKNAK